MLLQGEVLLMDNLKEQYDQIESERKGIIEQINALAENETVKIFFLM